MTWELHFQKGIFQVRLLLVPRPDRRSCTCALVWNGMLVRSLLPCAPFQKAMFWDIGRTCSGPTPLLAVSHSAARAGCNDCSELQMQAFFWHNGDNHDCGQFCCLDLSGTDVAYLFHLQHLPQPHHACIRLKDSPVRANPSWAC